MRNLRPSFNDIGILPSSVAYIDEERINLVFQFNDGFYGIIFISGSHFHYFQLQSHVTIQMLHGERHFRRTTQTINRISRFRCFNGFDVLQISFRKSIPIIKVFQFASDRRR